MLWLLMLIIIAVSVAISSNIIIGNSTTIDKVETTKTKIMYFAFLSYNQLNEYLSILIENNLIEYLDGTKTFKTTEKGLNLLKIHKEMAELLQTTFKNN